jgi:hypothetical protein
MNNTALILGNGKSRDYNVGDLLQRKSTPTNLTDVAFVYGCNKIYLEDIEVDVIVATDPVAQHQIYREYDGGAELLFLDWESVPSEMAAAVASFDQNVIANEYTPHGCVVSGEDNITMMTYLKESDNVTTVSPNLLPHEMSSGSMAMWDAAERSFDTIYLAGFGDIDHVHYDQLRGNEEQKKLRWEEERRYLIGKYSEINWVYL